MKKTPLFIFLLFLTFNSYSQSAFDKALLEISSDISNKLNVKAKKRVVVLFITDINKQTTIAGKYLANIISINIVNDVGNFQVFDRENLNSIAEANKLIAEGYIDVDKTKELGKLLEVDAIIIGNYTILSATMKLTTKALDAMTGFVIAAAMKDLPLDNDAGALLGINTSFSVGSTDLNNSNRGFNNVPLNSNESYNNPETVNKACEINKTGDYCFTNKTSKDLVVDVYYDAYAASTLTLGANQTQCFYNIAEGTKNYFINEQTGMNASYNIVTGPDGRSVAPQKYSASGQINIERCKSKTFVVK